MRILFVSIVSSRRPQDISSRLLQDVSSRRLQDMSSRRLQDMSSRRLQDVISVTIFRLPRRLQDVKLLRLRRLEDIFKTCLEDVFKTSSKPTNVCWGRSVNLDHNTKAYSEPLETFKGELFSGNR